MKSGRFYLDTSAYLCVLLGENGHEALLDVLEDGALFSSAVLPLECHRILVSLARDGRLSSDELGRALERLEADLALFALHDVTLDLCRLRTMPLVATPHAIDLVHLRTALAFHAREPLTRFVSTDESLIAAARELSLPV
ncbi:MAG: PIN domain-containing protein [Myxococcaceae bacterium]